MQNRIVAKLLTLVALDLLLISGPLEAGIIVGRVRTCQDSTALDFANVVIDGTTIGAMSHNGGTFVIEDVPSGHWNLRISLTGYPRESQPVTIRGDEIVELDLCLRKPNPFAIEHIDPSIALDAELQELVKTCATVHSFRVRRKVFFQQTKANLDRFGRASGDSIGGYPVMEVGPALSESQRQRAVVLVMHPEFFIWKRYVVYLDTFGPSLALVFPGSGQQVAFLISTSNGMVHIFRKRESKRWIGVGSFTIRPRANKFSRLAAELFPTHDSIRPSEERHN